MTQHIGELAELYAAGTLGDEQRDQVDAHVQQCAECARRLGESEAAVAALVKPVTPSVMLDSRIREALDRGRPRVPWRTQAALVAAAFVVGLLPAIYLWNATTPQRTYSAQQQQAVVAMVRGHFLHAAFVPLTPAAPPAKVIYGRTAPWRYFVVETNRPLTIADGAGTPLGTLSINGAAGQLFVANAHGARTFLLMDGTRPLARVVAR